MSNDQDTPRNEYSEDLIRSGERGNFTKADREGTHIVLIDPDPRELFPTSEAVNRALRDHIATKRSAA